LSDILLNEKNKNKQNNDGSQPRKEQLLWSEKGFDSSLVFRY